MQDWPEEQRRQVLSLQAVRRVPRLRTRARLYVYLLIHSLCMCICPSLSSPASAYAHVYPCTPKPVGSSVALFPFCLRDCEGRGAYDQQVYIQLSVSVISYSGLTSFSSLGVDEF